MGAYAADIALARRCAAGEERAWEEFVRIYRPLLYRAADVLDPSGGARELADSLYAELYGVGNRGEQRASLLRYYEGRSSLGTWLRAVLAQRHVDRLRTARRVEPIDDQDVAANADEHDPDRGRYVCLLREALAGAVARLAPRDRLRLAAYYVQELTLAETGRMVKESEATVSRQLSRTRAAIRRDVERRLREAGLGDDQITACFASVADDPGPLDLKQVIYE